MSGERRGVSFHSKKPGAVELGISQNLVYTLKTVFTVQKQLPIDRYRPQRCCNGWDSPLGSSRIQKLCLVWLAGEGGAPVEPMEWI
jgi:hypothetical protein